MDTTGPDKQSCTCPICMYIMIEPVTMPCKHTLCIYCYKQTVAQSNLVCPICRQRISVWARRAAKTNTLVDQKKWVVIQRAFPQKVKKRMEGMAGGFENEVDDEEDDSDDQDCETYLRKLKELSKPGEIHQEYEAAMRKLQQQRELEAKKEEEASAALIQALQEEEEKEMERIRREREDAEKLGLAMAQQLEEVSFEELKSRGLLNSPQGNIPNNKSNTKTPTPKMVSKSKKNTKPGRPMSASDGKMNTMNNFFSPVPRTPSAPPSYLQLTKQEQQKKELSPYPFACISPVDKIFYGLSTLGESANSTPRHRRCSSSSDEAPGLIEEHSYTTASAPVIDLTNPAVSSELCSERSDIPQYDLMKVKSEPEDIFGPGPSGLNTFVPESPVLISTLYPEKSGVNGRLEYLCPTAGNFKPIIAHQRTPPKRQANGVAVDTPIMKTTPKMIVLDSPSPISIHTKKPLALKTASPKMKSATGVGKTTAAAMINKRAEEALRNSAKTSESFSSLKSTSASYKGYDNVAIHPSNNKILNCNAEPSEKLASEAFPICLEDELPDIEQQAQESNMTYHANTRAMDNRSDQENLSEMCENELCSSPVWGLTGSVMQPLKIRVSRSSNKPLNTRFDITVSESISDSAWQTDKKEINVGDGSKCKPLNKPVNKNSITKKHSDPSKKSGAKGKKSAPSGVNTTLDSFVQRKKRTFSCTTNQDLEKSHLTQEEKDHLLALQLQEIYENLDKSKIYVDRFKGSVNEYSFRKKRKV